MENYGLAIVNVSDKKENSSFNNGDKTFVSYIFKGRKITTYELINPTESEFINKINTIKSKTTSNNITYIYISCHGSTTDLSILKYKDSMSFSKLKSYLDTINGKKVLIIDSCHSGSCITDVEETAVINSQFFNKSINEGYASNISSVFRDNNYFVLTACAANQTTPFNSDGSYFTTKMCQAINNCPTHRYATLSGMAKYVRDSGINACCYPEESYFPIFSDYPLNANSKYYLVEAKVANVKGAGTDANIRIRFIGHRGSSRGSYLLDHNNVNDFEQNKVYQYIVECNDSIGSLQSIEISSDNAGKDPSLIFEYIKVINTSTNTEYKTTNASSYVINEKNPSRTFNLRITHYNTYNVTITIGKEDGAGTDANVSIQFVGTNGSTIPYLLDSPVDDFERASSNTYKVKIAGNIGELLRVIISSDKKGKSPDFHITHVAIEDMTTHVRYSASKSVYFNSKGRTHDFTLWKNTNVEYFVNIQIANTNNAGTDANIYIRLRGTNRATDFILLDHPEKDDFERNTYNLFKVNAENLGTLQDVTIRNGYEGKGADMKINYIEITDKSINKKYRLKGDCWLDSNHGKDKVFTIPKN
ncbi:PLAT/LH2 domain-containing protein [Ruminococcus sp.]|uniref:PLAT/LH2 domain-containing protein n=1 Tax=Ruminococcus sp. TaxID=41978 RepID=UPI0025DEEECE|nr:PLAT/LH2 domain-containing protein [Ruminococcus sp.]